MSKISTEALAGKVKMLKDDRGMSFSEIGELLGFSKAYAHQLYHNDDENFKAEMINVIREVKDELSELRMLKRKMLEGMNDDTDDTEDDTDDTEEETDGTTDYEEVDDYEEEDEEEEEEEDEIKLINAKVNVYIENFTGVVDGEIDGTATDSKGKEIPLDGLLKGKSVSNFNGNVSGNINGTATYIEGDIEGTVKTLSNDTATPEQQTTQALSGIENTTTKDDGVTRAVGAIAGSTLAAIALRGLGFLR